MKNKVSLCMIVKDEEECLARCLDSVKDLVDEIIIVDTGSIDRTLEIARSFGAKLYYLPWSNDFSAARNEALRYATQDWILIMDADEELFLEDREALEDFLRKPLDEENIYFFQGISYLGDKVDENNTTISLSPRLFKNNLGTHYEGPIHNQLMYKADKKSVIEENIRIHHYGYLNSRLDKKQKSDRNIPILEEQLKKDPTDGFANFNLGTEYHALGELDIALQYYYEAYKKFDCNNSYSFRLILRIALANYNLKKYEDALNFVEIGIQSFENCTDLYYIKALIYKGLNKVDEQIAALNKCISIGEPPIRFRYLNGTGSYGAYNELAEVYWNLKDYEKAYSYYKEVIKLRPDYIIPLCRIINIMKIQGLATDKIKIEAEKLYENFPIAYYILAEAFHYEGEYGVALRYIKKCKAFGIDNDKIQELEQKCIEKVGNGYFEEHSGTLAKRNEVSLCMIVKNEEKYLARCLDSLKDIVDEIIIVDTGSTDRTIDIAKSFNAKVYEFPWNNNFSEARNESLKHATKDWILIIDADEEVFKEDQEVIKALLDSKLDDNAIYSFQGVNYIGTTIDENNTVVNLNPRLFKNSKELYYQGEIHNQLTRGKDSYYVICENIKIHHYGYLNKKIADTKKRKRNLEILKGQLEKNPEDKFILFNLGNEFSALGKYDKALEFYNKAYDNFNPEISYNCVLIIRMVLAYINLEKYEEALKLIEAGEKYYPKCTDLYFMKADIYKTLRKPTLRIKALKKCIELGEAPLDLRFLSGTGGTKAYYELGRVYQELNDYEAAYEYYTEALKADSNMKHVLYDIIRILKFQNLSLEEIREEVEQLLSSYAEPYVLLIKPFFYEGFYETCLEYLSFCNESSLNEELKLVKSSALIRCGRFTECVEMKELDKKSSFYIKHLFNQVIAYMLLANYKAAEDLLQELDNDLSDYDTKLIEVAKQLINLFSKMPTTEINKDEAEVDYIDIILEVCEIMLINKKYDELSLTVKLANLVNNKKMLLKLGKLYYRYGYVSLAKVEILRSMKELDIYDNEGLDILKV